MLHRQKNVGQSGFCSTLEEQLSHKHPLYILANRIDRQKCEDASGKLYAGEGRPAKPIRLMASLLLLKPIRNISDESVAEQWEENSYLPIFQRRKNGCRRCTARHRSWYISVKGLAKKHRAYL